MRIRWLIPIGGTVEGRVDGVKPGDEMDLPEFNAKRYIKAGHAEEVVSKRKHEAAPEERAVAPDEEVEKAVSPAHVAKRTAHKPPAKRAAGK